MLRYSYEAQRAFMDVTYGDPRNITEANIQTALDRARHAAAEPAEAARAEAQARADAAEDHEVQARFDAEQSQAEAAELQRRLDAVEARQARAEEAIRNRITRRATFGARAAKFSAGAIVVASVIVGMGSFFPSVIEWLPSDGALGLKIGALVGLLVGTWTLWKGKSITEWIDHWRDSAIRRAIRRAGMDEPEVS